MKYKTLAELVEAYKSGELSKENRLTIDNDSTSVYEYSEDDDDGETVFEGDMPRVLLEQALDLLGVPWQNA